MPVRVSKKHAPKLANETAHMAIEGFEEDYMVGIGMFMISKPN